MKDQFQPTKIHFHSLDAFRFFAFLQVYFLHLPLDSHFYVFSFLKNSGALGVSFFFVLSGFLITYLLVQERRVTGKIDAKKFMIRRILRIWPLFFLLVFTIFLLPETLKNVIGLHLHNYGYDVDWRFSFTFLENYKMIVEDQFPKTTPLQVFWTLCIEEHFYILWLIVLFFLPVKNFLRFFILTIPMAWVARAAYRYFLDNNLIAQDLFTNLDYFGCGAILGFGIANHYDWFSEKMNAIATKWKWAFIVIALTFLFLQHVVLPYRLYVGLDILKPTVIALLLAGILACFLPMNGKLKLTHPMLNYLGKISYGLYVYHLVLINIAYQYLFDKGYLLDDWLPLILFILVTLSGTILVSMLSYHVFEKPFLSLREQITR
jgi:peptidoglycan/LPS O-acetylase OafA/YrhL